MPLLDEWGFDVSYHNAGNGNAHILAFEIGSTGFWWQIRLGDAAEDEQVKHMTFSMSLSVDPAHLPVGKICNDYTWRTCVERPAISWIEPLGPLT